MAKQITAQKGQCMNIGLCNKANSKEEIEVVIGEEFICPEPDCGWPLKPIPKEKNWLPYILACLGIIGIAIALFFILPPPQPPTVLITPETPTVPVGETVRLTAKIEPEKDGQSWSWTSGDESIATVSDRGEVKGVSTGSVTITATVAKGKASASVTVDVKNVPVESVTLDEASLSLDLKDNKSKTLTATVLPENATNKNVEWSLDKPSVATVSSTGLVTAVAKGTATITVTADDGKMATCIVTIDNGNPPPPSFSCGKYTGELRNGQPHGLGTFTYNRRSLIDDLKMVYAEQGDYITGTFREGRIVSVQLFSSGGNLKQTVIPQQPASICRQ